MSSQVDRTHRRQDSDGTTHKPDQKKSRGVLAEPQSAPEMVHDLPDDLPDDADYMTLRIKLEATEVELAMISFDFHLHEIEIEKSAKIGSLSDLIEVVFMEQGETAATEGAAVLALSIVAVGTKPIREVEGEAPVGIDHEVTVEHAFANNDIVHVLGEVSEAEMTRSSPEVPPQSTVDRWGARKTPVTFITGFVGAGKTTLISHILADPHGHRLAIIENEYGEPSFDDVPCDDGGGTGGAPVTQHGIVVTTNSCLCCTVRENLVEMAQLIFERNDQTPVEQRTEAILIETTGMADPSPVIRELFRDQQTADRCIVDGVIAVVDAKRALQELVVDADGGAVSDGAAELSEQIAVADRIILNKVDFVQAKQMANLLKAVRAINQYAAIFTSVHGVLDVEVMLGVADREMLLEPLPPPEGPYSPAAASAAWGDEELEMESPFQDTRAREPDWAPPEINTAAPSPPSPPSPPAAPTLRAIGTSVTGTLDSKHLKVRFDRFMKAHKIRRGKGMLTVGGLDRRVRFVAIAGVLQFEESELFRPDQARDSNNVVFVSEALDVASLAECFVAEIIDGLSPARGGPRAVSF